MTAVLVLLCSYPISSPIQSISGCRSGIVVVLPSHRLDMLNNEQQNRVLKVTLTTDDIQNILNLKNENQIQCNTILPGLESINLEITPGELCSNLSSI